MSNPVNCHTSASACSHPPRTWPNSWSETIRTVYGRICSSLPDQLIHSTHLVPFFALYRYGLGKRLLQERMTVVGQYSSDRIASPFLATFPVLMEYTDIVDVLRSVWNERAKTLTKDTKVNTAQIEGICRNRKI